MDDRTQKKLAELLEAEAIMQMQERLGGTAKATDHSDVYRICLTHVCIETLDDQYASCAKREVAWSLLKDSIQITIH
ncbi:hypothetical protein GVX82_01940 [Patescibacteria group bacterium]|nr:hypothetical protein [Patescibacteria group bacterium]